MKILISNRGECALRINRAAKQLGYKTVSVYAKGDEAQIHLRDVDEAICIGNARSSDSYLNINNIITAAQITQCNAIHPGYGFLAESHLMAEATEKAGLIWIGPSSYTMNLLKDKNQGRIIAQQHGLDVISGSNISNKLEELINYANKIGYPIMLKAANGGGGKGMRQLRSEEELIANFPACQLESLEAYKSNNFIIEAYLEKPKHIEVQILVNDSIHILGYRDCSIQSRYQKIIEESFFPEDHGIDTAKLEKNIASLLLYLNYQGLGTLEFLFYKDNFYFIELNARMQVEHTVTECQTGIDLIQAQILTAYKQNCSVKHHAKLHAIESRINLNSFKKGDVIQGLRWPGGNNVRIDSHIYPGYKVPYQYDAMLGKLICSDTTREKAIQRMLIALSETIVDGIDHNIQSLYHICSHEFFLSGSHHTQLHF